MTRARALTRLVAALVTSALLLAAAPALASGLTREEQQALLDGGVVRRPLDVEIGGERYFGGVAYVLVEAPPEAVIDALLDVAAMRAVFPMTLEAADAGRLGEDRLIFLRQGVRLANAAWTAIVRRESPSVLKFWLDPTQPHDVADCWGYFRVDPFDGKRSLFTYGAVLDLEAGFVRLFFTEKIRRYALDMPLQVKRYVEGRVRKP